jgi:hypothetical protein
MIRSPGATGRVTLLDQPQGRNQQLRTGWFEVCPDANYERPAAAVEWNPDASGVPFVGTHGRSHHVIEAAVLHLLHHHFGAAGPGRKPETHLESISPVVQNNGHFQNPRLSDGDPFDAEVDRNRARAIEDFDVDTGVKKPTELTDEQRTPRPRGRIPVRESEVDPVRPGPNNSFREDNSISIPLRSKLE